MGRMCNGSQNGKASKSQKHTFVLDFFVSFALEKYKNVLGRKEENLGCGEYDNLG
jgi:hypothetical protein